MVDGQTRATPVSNVARWLRRLVAGLCLILLVAGCDRAAEDSRGSEIAPGLLARPLNNAPSDPNATRFTKLTAAQSGIDFVNRIKPQNNFPYLNSGAGVATGDYDNDGLVDIYLASIDSRNRLYRQVAPFQFVDVTEQAGVDGGEAWSRGTSFVDIDNDGDLDLYVCNTEAPNLLYINNGDGTFREAAREFGLDHVGASCMASFVDYDRDGDLDCYLVTYRALHFMVPEKLVDEMEAPTATQRSPRQMRPQLPTRNADGSFAAIDPNHWFRAGPRYEISGETDVLFRNDGNGHFVDVTAAAGVMHHGPGLSATWLDIDADGWLDLHVANDLLVADRMYRNNTDGTFSDVVSQAFAQTTWFSMGADCADVNNDSRVDLLVADMSATTHYRSKVLMGSMANYQWFMTHAEPRQVMRNALYLNSGVDRFLEIAQLAGIAKSDWTWAVQLADLDNDGWVDAFFTNGAPRDDMNSDYLQAATDKRAAQGDAAFYQALRSIPPAPDANLAFRNTGDLQFEDVSQSWGLDHQGVSFGLSIADLDRDGDLDLVVSNMNEPVSIYRNDGAQQHSIVVQLQGIDDNRFGIGAQVRVQTASTTQQRRLMLARGFMSSNDPVLHFGFGKDEHIVALEVEWPNGKRQRFENLAVDRFYEITEPSEAPTPVTAPPARPTPQFVEASNELGISFRHRERPYDDFANQPLLPGKLSQLGPGVAVGDIDADGDADVFVGGAAGQAGAMYVNQGAQGLERVSGVWIADTASEDMAPLFFDADGDNDLDLYVTSGGVEYAIDDVAYHDRLYLNEGNGSFVPAPPATLPNETTSSGCVAAADFDRDGDLDLFIGGRVVPGSYPVSPRSFLLRNDAGRFVDVTDDWAPELRNAGMVTSAIWSDVNADARIDLLLTLEWGPIRLFHNEGQTFAERTREAGLQQLEGWWNSIAGGDLDRDGDIDYVVMNCGWNTKYGVPTESKPTMLFYGDMEGDGTYHLIEAKTSPDHLLPMRGRSCSSGAMPYISDVFPTYHSFASATLEQIYDPDRLHDALTMRATTLASGVLRNDGAGHFTWQPLPRIAQISPGFGVAMSDFDADGNIDIYTVQNSFSREPETGLWAGGLSLLLHGEGSEEGNTANGSGMTPIGADRSGLVVRGDAKGLALLDLDRNGWPDIMVTQNDDRLLTFSNQGVSGRRSFSVALRGPKGNPTGVGARLTLEPGTPYEQTAEVYAGSGYLSQSASEVFFGVGQDSGPLTIAVAWPDGQESTHTIPLSAMSRHPLDHPDFSPSATDSETSQ